MFVLDSVVVLPLVVVMASAHTQAPHQELTGVTLQQMSSTSVADALKFFSGVQLKDYGGVGGQKTINVRTMGTQHTGVFYDGVRLTNTQNGTVDLGQYQLLHVGRVELFNANKAQPLLSASEYSAASAIYFTTAVPDTSQTTLMYHYGSFNSHSLTADRTWKNRAFVCADAHHTDGNYPFRYKSQYEDTTGVRRNSRVDFVRLEGGLFRGNFKGHAYAYYTDREIPGGVVRRLSDRFGDVGREKHMNAFVQGSYSLGGARTSEFKFNGRLSYDWLNVDTDMPENQFIHYNNTYSQRDAYLSAAASLPLRYVVLSQSTDVRLSDLDCDVYGMDYVVRTDLKVSLAAQSSNLKVGPWPATIYAYGLYTRIKDHTDVPGKDVSRPSFGAHVSLAPAPWLTLRSFYKDVYRVPTFNDLYYTNVGYRLLNPETTHQFDIGFEATRGPVNLQMDYYYITVDNKIICIPQGSSYNWRMVNRGLTETKGVDLSVRYAGRHWNAFYTGTYSDVRDLTDPNSPEYDHTLIYSPKWSHSLIVGYADVFSVSRRSFDYNLTLSGMYCGKRWWSYASPDDYLDKYFCLDAKVQLSHGRFRLDFECDNVLNQYHELIQRWPLPARRVKVGLVVRI